MMKKSKKKVLIIISVIVGILLLLLIVGYIAINSIFSMFSDSFYQVSLQELDGEKTTEQASPTPEANGGATATPAPDDSQPGKPKDPDEINLSPEKSKELMDAVPFSDKLSVLTILSKNLSAENYREIMGMLGGGITPDEVKRAKEILRNNLSPEDKQKIKDYYNEYSVLLD
ncbi:MAG: hypothetical protein E7403_00285 [Ruminococcaceae bacterium]|nr:hypothetical protein [Oscillospiraceae bacterium]